MSVANSFGAFVTLLDTQLPDLIVFDWTGETKLPRELLSFVRVDILLRQTPILHFGEVLRVGKESETNSELEAQIPADVCGEQFTHTVQQILEAQDERETEGLHIGGLHLDVRAGTISATAENRKLEFGPTEVRFLAILLRNPDVVLNRNQLLDRVWGNATDVEARTVDVHVARIRKRLRPFELHYQIQTVRGVGYRFVPD